METYNVNCVKCKRKTLHMVAIVNRMKGVKLKCCSCGYTRPRYIKDIQTKIKVEQTGRLGNAGAPINSKQNGGIEI